MTFHYREVALDKREPLIVRAKELILEAGYKVRQSVCKNPSVILLTEHSLIQPDFCKETEIGLHQL